MTPARAMLLAAGLGTRMRPLTDAIPKPLLPVGGKPLIDRALDRLAAAGVEEVVVNTHWQGEILAAHLARRAGPPRTRLQHESTLLDTGGAVAAALAEGLLGPEPFFVVNGDVLWLDGPHPALVRLSESFDPARHDGLLLVHRTWQVSGEVGAGDFMLDPLGTLRWRKERELVPYVYAGIQLVRPALFRDTPRGAFGMSLVWSRAIEEGRLAAIVHDGLWFHLSTPADLVAAQSGLDARETGRSR
ncbi:MAG TPA: nucleotidyltransferase family protein [Acetobacteraceae bacterium]|jgi:MurNAc alpha-1-phosphate uridylyltransferase|nr:nucleotidyltransferase family protein [Acetobacteraceae bacterium]